MVKDSVEAVGVPKAVDGHKSAEINKEQDSSLPKSTPDQSPPEKIKGHAMLSPFTPGWQMTDMEPLVITRSEGLYVYDIKGNKYFDGLAGLWNNALGGNEPRLVAAAMEQLNTLPFYHSFWNRTTKPSLDLAQELIDLFKPSKMAKVFFANSGSECNDSQVKLVWYYNNALGRPNKKKVIARQKAYHGSTFLSASLTGLPNLHQGFDSPASFVLHTECPHYWRFHLPGENEEEFATRLANNLEKLIIKEGPDTIAAFIAEPLMGAGGVIPPPATYFDKVQEILKKYDILFIADEVICGFGRLGTMFGCEKYNIKPDMVSLAKALSSGYIPIGAILISQPVADAIIQYSSKLGGLGHGFTYSGHPVACAVALEALKIYKERNIVEHVQSVTPLFQNGFRRFAESPVIGEIRGEGLVLAVEFTDGKSPNNPFPSDWAVSAYCASQCTEAGLLVRLAGDGIFVSPSLIITADEIQELIALFEKALRKTEEYVAGKRAAK